MMTCTVCGGAVFPSGQVIGYGGPICLYGGRHPTFDQFDTQPSLPPTLAPYPLTADEVRRIVREELDRHSGNARGDV